MILLVHLVGLVGVLDRIFRIQIWQDKVRVVLAIDEILWRGGRPSNILGSHILRLYILWLNLACGLLFDALICRVFELVCNVASGEGVFLIEVARDCGCDLISMLPVRISIAGDPINLGATANRHSTRIMLLSDILSLLCAQLL